jgi:hypothetical protein
VPSEQIETVAVHDLHPGGDEVFDESLLGIVLRIDLGDRAQHRVRSEDQIVGRRRPLELAGGAVAALGPCLDAYRSGQPMLVDDLRGSAARWPAFAAEAGRCGFRAVAALPMRLRQERVGGLNLFLDEPGSMTDANLGVAQALADVATIGILHQRVLSHSEQVNQQLQTALDTRLVIEQAKGILAERGRIDMSQAFVLLRARARSTNRRLADLAHAIVDGADTTEVLGGAPARR